MSNIISQETGQKRVAIYIRVSTAEQKIEGYSLEAQKKKLLDYINNNESLGFYIKPEWTFKDVHTGSDLNRKGLNELRQMVKDKKVDAVLVWKIDRLSRSLKHLLNIFEDFEKNEVSFISVQENIDFRGAIGKLIFQIFGAIAQFERELIKGRTQMGKMASAEMGNYTGTAIPYGYKPVQNPSGKGKKLAIIAEEKKWVEEIFNWYIFEEFGFGQIAKKLNDLKVARGKHGKTENKFLEWTEKIIRNLVQNPIYRGEFVANKKDENGKVLPEDQWTIVDIPPCISDFTFQQAQIARKSRTGGKKSTDYLLTGKMIDMTLDKPKSFSGAKRSKGGHSYRRKQFSKNNRHYSVFEVPAKQIEELVWEKIIQAMKEPEVFVNHYLSKKYTEPSKIQKLENELSTLRQQRINTELAIARIEQAYENGGYSEEKMLEKVDKKSEEITEIEIKIQEIEDNLSFMGSINTEVKNLKEASEQVKYRLENLNRQQKKIICNLFIDRVEMYRKKVNNKWAVSADVYFRFNPEKLAQAKQVDRTAKSHDKKKKDTSVVKNVSSGGQGQN